MTSENFSKSQIDIYDSPIQMVISSFHDQLIENYEDQIVKAVCRAGIDIDKPALIAAINGDRRRYEEAYNAGYSACKKEYEERMFKIAKLTGVYLESEDE